MRNEKFDCVKARVSIGMPVFNGEKFIEEALDSILNQTFTNFELIISDNALLIEHKLFVLITPQEMHVFTIIVTKRILEVQRITIASSSCPRVNILNGLHMMMCLLPIF